MTKRSPQLVPFGPRKRGATSCFVCAHRIGADDSSHWRCAAWGQQFTSVVREFDSKDPLCETWEPAPEPPPPRVGILRRFFRWLW